MADDDDKKMDITQLSLEQLQSIRKALNDEIQMITSSFGNLKVAHSRYGHSVEALAELKKPENANKDVFVPLTSSLYIPGKLSDVQNVLVDIGTGFYVERPLADANRFVEQKQEMLQTNLDLLQKQLIAKKRDLESVSIVFQAKLSQLQEAQRAQLAKQAQIVT